MSVTTETLRIVNEVVYKGKAEAQKLDSDLKKVDAGNTKAKMSMGQLATAAGAVAAGFGVVAAGAKQFYDTLKAGAEIQAAAFTFDNLTASIGSTSDAMLGDLQAATKGMISDLDLMRFASQTVAMGLGSTNEEVAALAELGSTLGAAFRGDAVAGMEEFNLLLANQSIPRLDSFGISAGAVRTRIAELQEQFPDMTREAAFTQAVLEQGQETMAKLGDNSETAAASMGVLEANLKTAKDKALEATTEGFTPLIVALADLSTLANDFGVNVDWNEILGGIGFGPGRELTTILEEIYIAGVAIRDNPWWVWFNDGLSGVGDTIEDTRWQLARMENDLTTGPLYSTGPQNPVRVLTEEIKKLPPVAISYVNSMTRMGDAHDQTEAAVRDTTDAVEENIEVIDRAAIRQEILAKNVELAAEAHRQFNATLGDYFVEISTAEEFTFDASQELYNLVGAGDASAETMAGLATALGLMSAEEAEAFLKTTVLRGELMLLAEEVIAGDVALEDAALAAQGLADGLFNTYEEALRAAEAARLLKVDLDNIPRNITVSVNVEGQTVVQQNGSGAAITSATGNVFPHGGYSMVGEFGPEFVRLPAGAQVISTNRTVNNSNSTTINGATRRGEQVLLQHLRRQSRPATILG